MLYKRLECVAMCSRSVFLKRDASKKGKIVLYYNSVELGRVYRFKNKVRDTGCHNRSEKYFRMRKIF